MGPPQLHLLPNLKHHLLAPTKYTSITLLHLYLYLNLSSLFPFMSMTILPDDIIPGSYSYGIVRLRLNGWWESGPTSP